MKDKIKKNLKYIIIVIVVLFIGTFVYNYMNKKEAIGVEEEVYATNIDQEAQSILETLDAIEKIKIDNSFFSENIVNEEGNLISFFNLIDFSLEELPEKPFGKENPFLEGSSLDSVYIAQEESDNTVGGEVVSKPAVNNSSNSGSSTDGLTEEEKKVINSI